jgi:hypothetical protein
VRNLHFIAKKMLDLWRNTQISEKSLVYWIGLVESNLAQLDLYTLLSSTSLEEDVSQKKNSFLHNTPRRVSWKFDKSSFRSVCSPEKERLHETPTFLEALFNQMNKSFSSRMRKMAAYILCVITFNNHQLQTEIWSQFNFTPNGNIVILNSLPKHLFFASPSPKGISARLRMMTKFKDLKANWEIQYKK